MSAIVTPIHRDGKADATARASWKFTFMETVNADPLCTPACLKVICAYLSFASDTTPSVYMSKSELAIRTGLSDATIKRTRRLLVKHGYLKREGKTKGGAFQYRLANNRQQLIADHMNLSRETVAERNRDRKRLERARAGIKMSPPKTEGRAQNYTPHGDQNEPQYRREYRRGISYEGNEHLVAHAPLSVTLQADDPATLFPIPNSNAEAEGTLQQIVNGRTVSPYIISTLEIMLARGTLTTERANRLISQDEEVAA